jgi:acyl carrier protein
MGTFSLDELQTIARGVIGDRSIALSAEGMAEDVPGWDSLSHTLIIMEVNEKLGIELPPNRAARARNFQHLVKMIHNELARAR